MLLNELDCWFWLQMFWHTCEWLIEWLAEGYTDMMKED